MSLAQTVKYMREVIGEGVRYGAFRSCYIT